MYNNSVPSRYSWLQLMTCPYRSSGCHWHSEDGWPPLWLHGRIVVAQFGPGPQLNCIGRPDARTVCPVAPAARDAQVQQVPAFVFIKGQTGDAALQPPLAGAEEIAAGSVIGTESHSLQVTRSSSRCCRTRCR